MTTPNIHMTPRELESLEELLNYNNSEERNFEEFIENGGKYKKHIQYHIDILWIFLQRESGKVASQREEKDETLRNRPAQTLPE